MSLPERVSLPSFPDHDGVPARPYVGTWSDLDDDRRPTPLRVAALDYLTANEERIYQRVITALFERYPEWRAEYLDTLWKPTPAALAECPEIGSPQELRPLIALRSVHLLDVERDGVGYVGLGFHCEWEDEHGLGVVLHLDRVVAIGSADLAFLFDGEDAPAD